MGTEHDLLIVNDLAIAFLHALRVQKLFISWGIESPETGIVQLNCSLGKKKLSVQKKRQGEEEGKTNRMRFLKTKLSHSKNSSKYIFLNYVRPCFFSHAVLKLTSGFWGAMVTLAQHCSQCHHAFCRTSTLPEGYFSNTLGVTEEAWLCESSDTTSSLEELRILGKETSWIHQSFFSSLL